MKKIGIVVFCLGALVVLIMAITDDQLRRSQAQAQKNNAALRNALQDPVELADQPEDAVDNMQGEYK